MQAPAAARTLAESPGRCRAFDDTADFAGIDGLGLLDPWGGR
jgi:hypothetical protein